MKDQISRDRQPTQLLTINSMRSVYLSLVEHRYTFISARTFLVSRAERQSV